MREENEESNAVACKPAVANTIVVLLVTQDISALMNRTLEGPIVDGLLSHFSNDTSSQRDRVGSQLTFEFTETLPSRDRCFVKRLNARKEEETVRDPLTVSHPTLSSDANRNGVIGRRVTVDTRVS